MINLSFFRQDSAQVVDGVAGAFDGALAAGEAEGLVDVREVVTNLLRPLRLGFRRATSPGRGGFGAHPNGFPYDANQ